MQLGIHLPHIGRKAGPDSIRRAAVLAEEVGFDDVWVSEHIIVPNWAVGANCVMAGLGPAIHDLRSAGRQVVDGRHKAGHDTNGGSPPDQSG